MATLACIPPVEIILNLVTVYCIKIKVTTQPGY